MTVQRYRLDDLGWQLFEGLCQSVLVNKFPGVQAWGGSGDWGRDAFYQGVLPIPDVTFHNVRSFVFQAKFIENANVAGAKPGPALRKAISAEIDRIRHRTAPDCFVLMTNAPLSADLRTSIEALLAASLPNANLITWGSAELSAFLDDMPEVRISFPLLLSLRDLRALIEGVVHKAAHARSAEMLERAVEEAQFFVETRAHRDTIVTLIGNGIAVLSGPPEMGKTTIAHSIALARAIAGWRYYAVRSAEELLSLHEPKERQIFVADDAFGSTEYRPALAEEWAGSLESVLRKVNADHWVIWTTRSAPLKAALQNMHLQGIAEKFPDPASVIVSASELTQREKALMLYAHAKVANLSAPHRAIVKEHAEAIVKHVSFTPKRVQRFIRETLPSLENWNSLTAVIEREIRTPTSSMRKSFDALPEEHKQFLVGALDGPSTVLAFGRHAPNAQLSAREVEVKLLEHFIVRDTSYRATTTGNDIKWAHPSWRDMVIDYVAEAPGRRIAFLARCGVEGLALALSSDGGAQGERQFPFLKTDEDWNQLEQRMPSLLDQLDDEGADNLLALTKTLIRAPQVASGHVARVARCAQALLEGTRDYWNRTKRPIGSLALFYEVSSRAGTFVAGPDLRATWDALVKDAIEEIESPDYFTSYPALQDLWDVFDLIRENEPRFLKHIGFQDPIIPVAKKALDEFFGYLDGDGSLQYRQEYEEELDQVSSIEEHVERIIKTFPSLAESASRVAAHVSYARSRIREKLDEGVPERPRKPSVMTGLVTHRPVDETIDIVRLFSDL